MKLFLHKILFLVLLSIICIISICEIKITDEKVIKITSETSYEKIAWNLKLLNQNNTRFKNSYVFLGSSWVQGGINDSLLTSKGINSINMAVNHSGADLDYYFTKRIIPFKPQKILIHRFPNGQGVFHPMIPLLMTPLEYVSTFKQITFNFIFNFIPKRFFFVIKSLLIWEDLKPEKDLSKYFGWRSEGNSNIKYDSIQQNNLLNEKINLRSIIKSEQIASNGIRKSTNTYKNIWRRLLSIIWFGNGELIRIKNIQICNKSKIDVQELYIPNFADALYDSKHNDTNYFFIPTGFRNECLFIKNVSFLANQKFWYDPDHLNTIGSNIFTDSLYNNYFLKTSTKNPTP
jgi:hypothetical protein